MSLRATGPPSLGTTWWASPVPRSILEPGTYFYRVRLEAGGVVYAWSRPVKFVVHDGGPSSG